MRQEVQPAKTHQELGQAIEQEKGNETQQARSQHGHNGHLLPRIGKDPQKTW